MSFSRRAFLVLQFAALTVLLAAGLAAVVVILTILVSVECSAAGRDSLWLGPKGRAEWTEARYIRVQLANTDAPSFRDASHGSSSTAPSC